MTVGGGRVSLTAAPGAWAGVTASLSWADAATPTVFNGIDGGEYLAPTVRVVNLKAGDKLRVKISKPGGVPAATSINATYLE